MKNTFRQPVDTICLAISKRKKAAGEDTGEKPFLYLVLRRRGLRRRQQSAESAAATAYRNICITLDVRGKEIRQQQSRE